MLKGTFKESHNWKVGKIYEYTISIGKKIQGFEHPE